MSKLKESISFMWDKERKSFVNPVPEYIKQIVKAANERYRISTIRRRHSEDAV